MKVDHTDHPGLVRAEAAALQIAASIGLGDIEPELVSFGGVDCLIVMRYDRLSRPDRTIGRVHQEDACQALGIAPDSRPKAKYERHGGPSLRAIANLITIYSDDRRAELEKLLRIATFTTLIRNGNWHGKNVSLLYPTIGQPTLAPVYDSVPTGLFRLRYSSAMSIDGTTDFDAIDAAKLAAEAKAWGLNEMAAPETVTETIEQAADVAATSVDHRVAELVSVTSRQMLSRSSRRWKPPQP